MHTDWHGYWQDDLRVQRERFAMVQPMAHERDVGLIKWEEGNHERISLQEPVLEDEEAEEGVEADSGFDGGGGEEERA